MSLAEKRREDYKTGSSMEDFFIETLESKNFDIIKSTQQQDMEEGWDLYVTTISTNFDYPDIIGKRIDVKGIKGDDYNWVEFIAKNHISNKLGWSLREGIVDYIAFKRIEEFGNDFLLVKKSKLKEFIFEKIPLLKQFHDEIEFAHNDPIKYNECLRLKINSSWGLFNVTTNKDESLYDLVYTRDVRGRFSDMITKIKDSDLEKLATYNIK